MVYLRCTDAPTNIPMVARDGRAKKSRSRGGEGGVWGNGEKERGGERGGKTGKKRKGRRRDGKASSSSSTSRSRSRPRDKLLLMEEINFGLNRSPATL